MNYELILLFTAQSREQLKKWSNTDLFILEIEEK